MHYNFVFSTSLLLILQVNYSLTGRIQHPSLWLKSSGTLLLTASGNQKPSWNYIAKAHKMKAFKKCLLIQNIDGSTLQFTENNNTFSLTDNFTMKSLDLNTQMFILTLNLQAVKINHQDDPRIVQIIQNYIHKDMSNRKNFILIRAVYWPFYMCSDSNSVVYGSAIQNNSLSHDCIWFRVLSPSGYMNLLKLDQMPFFNITYQKSKALSSYPKNHLNLITFNHNLDRSSYWAVALSHLSIPRYRYQRSVALQFNNQVLPKLKFIFDHSKDLKRSILPTICLKLDKNIQNQINVQNEIFHKIHQIKKELSYIFLNFTEEFDRFLRFLPIFYDYQIKIESYNRNQRFYKRHHLSLFYKRNEVRIKNLEKEFSPKLIEWNLLRYKLCMFIVNASSCVCLTQENSSDDICSSFDFNKLMKENSRVWYKMPSDENILLAKIYKARYEGATSIIEKRRSFFQAQSKYYSVHSTLYFEKAQICL